MDITAHLQKLVMHPAAFFEESKKEDGYRLVFWTFFAASAISSLGSWWMMQSSNDVSSMLTAVTSAGLTVPSFLQHIDPMWFAVVFLANFVWSLLAVFISAYFLHVWIKMWKGTGAYIDTFRLFAYGMLPGLLLGWIPAIGGFMWIWTFVLNVIATEKVHGLSRGKSIWIYVLPTIVIGLLLGVVAIGFIALFVGK
jgi:hypothetical protein